MDLKLKNNPNLKQQIQYGYIVSNKDAYINTGVIAKTSIGIEMDFAFINMGGDVFGTTTTGYNGVPFCLECYSGSYYAFYYPGMGTGTVILDTNTKYHIELKSGKQVIYDVNAETYKLNTTRTISPFSNSNPILLFCRNSNNGATAKSAIKLYSCKIYEDDVLIRDYIPYSNNNVVCLYDKVNNTYYYNQGTNNFTYGFDAEDLNSSFLSKITSLYIKDCPNFNITFLRSIVGNQESTETKLSRVRLNIGNVSGSLQELLSYSTLNGFNDNYEEQVKPRLVGTWTINDYYTNAMLTEARSTFDGLTIVEDTAYNWETMLANDLIAVQTIDNTAPNYNPAAAVVLNNNSKGTVLANPLINGQKGRYFLTKTQAESITSIPNFYTSSISDSQLIVSDVVAVYSLSSFLELRYFTGITSIPDNFCRQQNLKKLIIPINVTTIGQLFAFNTEMSNIFVEILGTIATLQSNYFCAGGSNKRIHFTQNAIPSTVTSGVIHPPFENGSNGLVLVGSGSKLQCQAAYESWLGNNYFNTHVKSWYDYAAPQIIYSSGNVIMTVERTSTIYYTIDGSIPTVESTQYTEPFSWDGQGVIKAMAIDTTNIVGDIAYADDFYADTAADPTFILDTTNKTVTINCASSGVTIYYTIDGTYPTLNSNVYSEPITTQEDIIKVRCFAVKEGMNDSNVVGKICVLDDTLWGSDGDSSSFAVQTIDSTKPNYNPAVAIMLNDSGIKTDVCYGEGYYLSKTDCAAVTSSKIRIAFAGKTTLTDSFGIVTRNTSATYDFETFHEFKYFTVFPNPSSSNDSANCGFMNCTKLREITLPPINDLQITPSSWGRNAFSGCSKLETINNLEYVNSFPPGFASGCLLLKNFTLSTNITSIGNAAFQNAGRNATITAADYIELNLPNLTTLGDGAFFSCKRIRKIVNLGNITKIGTSNNNGAFSSTPLIEATLPITVTTIATLNFTSIDANAIIHLLSATPPAITSPSNMFTPNTVKLYVGDGSSAANDNAILQTYLADTNWATFSSRLNTWYNYLHPTT